MFGHHPFSNRTCSIATFTLGLILGVVAPNAVSLASGESAQIERVAGNDVPAAAQRSERPVSNPRAVGQSGAPSLADPPPPLVFNLQNGAGGIARRNEDSAKAGQQSSARDVAERALGFTAFIRRGPLYGAGILLDSAGHVLTCRHVIEGEDRIAISFHDTGPFTADVVDTDEKLDLALLHVDSRRATPAQVAPIFTVSTGDDVFGMGAPHKLRFSMSRGLVSYVGRPFDELYYLQTDLPTNSGNSGGPVMNDRGEVVGITTFIFRDSQGLAFALPIDYAFDRFKHLLGSSALDGNRFSAWREIAKQHARSGG